MEQICLENTLEQVVMLERMSVRSYHACLYGGLFTLKDILLHFQAHKNFLLLRGCGVMSSYELSNICNKYLPRLNGASEVLNSAENALEEKHVGVIKALSKPQRDILSMLYARGIKKLSATHMALFRACVQNDFSLENIYLWFIVNDNFAHLLKVKSRVLMGEMNKLRLNLVSITNDVVAAKRFSEFFAFYLDLYVGNVMTIPRKDLVVILQSGDVDGKVPTFKVLDALIERNSLFSNKQKHLVFKHTFNYWRNAQLIDLTKIGMRCNLTRERVRQLRISLCQNLDSSLNFLTSFDINILNLYSVDRASDLIFIDESLCKQINDREKTNFNEVFIARVFAVLLKDTHVLVSNEIRMVAHYRVNRRYAPVYAFLVSRRIAAAVDVDAMAYDLYMRRFAKESKLRHLLFEKYISKFLLKNNADDMELLRFVVSEILSNVVNSGLDGEVVDMQWSLSSLSV